MKRIPKSLKISNGRNVKDLNDIVHFLTGKTTYKKAKYSQKLTQNTLDALRGIKGLEKEKIVSDKGVVNPKVVAILNEKLIEAKYKQPVEIGLLQNSLVELNNKGILKAKILYKEITDKDLGKSTQDAIKVFQNDMGLPETGKMDALTEERLEEVVKAAKGKLVIKQVSEVFNPKNKSSVANLQRILLELNLGLKDTDAEIENRALGKKTTAAIKKFQDDKGLKETGKVDSDTIQKLNEALVGLRYKKVENVVGLHENISLLVKKKFINISRIVEVESKDELDKIQDTDKRKARKEELMKTLLTAFEKEKNNNALGAMTELFTKYFQNKYNLSPTGKIDVGTEKKLESVSSSIQGSKPQPKKQLKVTNAQNLNRVVGKLRLNLTGAKVADLQKSLAWMGYKISKAEFDEQRFGKTTKDAVLQFQKDNNLIHSGNTLNRDTVDAINLRIGTANPSALIQNYRVRGSVRNELWQPVGKVTVQVFERGVRGGDKLLNQKNTFDNGFFDILYAPPQNPHTKKPKQRINLVVKVVDNAGNVLHSKNLTNVKQTYWVNFTEGEDHYKGVSEFDKYSKLLKTPLEEAGINIEDIQQSDTHQDILPLAAKTKISPKEILMVSLSHQIANAINKQEFTAPVIYAFLRQNQPPGIPSDLFPDKPEEWDTWITSLVEDLATGITFLDDDVQKEIIENALLENYIPRTIKPKKDAILQEFTGLRKSFVLEKPILVGNGNVKQLLNLSNIGNAKHDKIAESFIKYEGISDSFWENVEVEAGLTPAENASFKTVAEMGIISQNHQPTLQILKGIIDDPAKIRFNSARDFAKLTQNEWETIINDGGGNVPDYIKGNNAAERITSYAKSLKIQSDEMFPSVAFVAEVDRNATHGLNHTGSIASFVYSNTNVDFENDNLEKINSDLGNVLTVEQVGEAKVMQRVLKIAPSALAGTELLNLKLHSSSQIYFYGKDRLTEILKPKNISEVEINKLYLRAEQQYAQVLAKISQFRYEFQIDSPIAVPRFFYTEAEVQQFQSDIPNIESLFGSLDYCQCKHCSSLYSPAAYLSDLLRFVGEKNAVQNNTSVQDILFNRRPDIKNIKLNCENTHTPLPYIDLVNEILENAIPPTQSDFSYQTTLSAEELIAFPEHLRPDAYVKLRAAKFPMKPTFNLWQQESRMFLQHLGVPRYELMKTFQNRVTNTPTTFSIAGEYFEISSEELTVIIPSPSNSDANATNQQVYWGTNNVTSNSLSVEQFLERSCLTYEELLALLQAKFVNPDNDKSVINRPVDNCDVGKQTVDRISLLKLDRMHRFIRLWRNCDWEIWELDLLIRKIGNGNLNENCLIELWKFSSLQKELNLSAEELLSFYDNINTEIRVTPDASVKIIEPLYHRLFLNKAVTNPVDSGFVLPIADNNMSGHTSTILSALAVSQSDFDLLISLTDGSLSENTLSILYRYVVLAKKLRLSVENLLRLISVTGIANPFSDLDTTKTFLKYNGIVKKSRASIMELEYVLTHAPDSPLGLREEVVIQYIESLRTNLSSLKSEIEGETETSRELIDKQLSKISVFETEEVRQVALDLIEGTWSLSEPERETFINNNFSEFIPPSSSPLTILTTLNYFDGNELTSVEEAEIQGRYDFILQHLYPYLSDNIIIEQLSSSLGISSEFSKILLQKLKLSGSPNSLISYFQTNSLVAKNQEGDFVNDINTTNFPNLFKAFFLSHKVATLLKRLNIKPQGLEWFIQHYSKVETINLENLPIDSGQASIPFPQWFNWQRFIQFKDGFPEPEDTSLYSILNIGIDNTGNPAQLTAKHLDILQGIAKLTKWDKAEVQNVSGRLGIKFDLIDSDYTKAETYHRIWECFKQIKVIGVNAHSMFNWAEKPLSLSNQQRIAKSIRYTAKSKYEPSEWLKKIQPIEDELRELKRDALANYLIELSLRTESPMVGGKPNSKYWDNKRDLFKYFLIDVEMNACQLSSRIKQAISSVQLFIQRCFLNLESRYVKIPKDDPDLENNWNQWKWMKNYRIWEANRKVFFYPENWIEPELRDDKSPFFKELENELLQNELTHPNVEQAFLNYLHKVDEVANLEIMSTYHDFHSEIEEVHVIARTKTIPHVYYHRTYNLDYEYWTPWEKLEIDITGNHVVPVVYNRKLHLFWLVITEKTKKVTKNPPARPSFTPKDNEEPPKILEIQLAWSIKKHTGWTGKVISKQKMIHPWQRPHFSYHLRPRYKELDNTLWVDLFISTSKEFNNNSFYNQRFDKKYRMTNVQYNQTYRPWHSSSFVFNGNITQLKLRAIPYVFSGYFYAEWKDSLGVTHTDETSSTNYSDSHFDVSTKYGEDGRQILKLSNSERTGRLLQPTGMHFEYNYMTNNLVHSKNTSNLNIISSGSATTRLLNSAKSPFRVVASMLTYDRRPVIYQDSKRSFFIKIEKQNQYAFFPFYHPYTSLFIRELNRSGLDGLLNRKIQVAPQNFHPTNSFNFTNTYLPATPHKPDTTASRDIVDFSFGGAYSIYNWEIFFHAPMLIAGKLSQNQRFEEAMKWYHYIFDPTNTENYPVPQRYWVTKPFYNHTSANYKNQRIENIINKIDEFGAQVTAWKNNPFKPHLIARYRPVAYQRNVVMKYIDNIIAWGDQLFRRDTMESINQASLLYILAYELLGDRPKAIPAIPRADKSFKELQIANPLDILGNTKVDALIENEIHLPIRVRPSIIGNEPLPRLEISYFCIPRNEKLMTYWDTVDDRLFKIRNCMNIEGIVRQLPLFAPPIDPALLVKAAAAGVDLDSVLNDLSVPSPHYRFRTLLQAAIQFCNHVKSLGDQLLVVLEKKDAEGLALLRASNEIELQKAVKELRKLQIDEAEETVKGLEFAKSLAEKRKEYYEGREFMSGWEIAAAVLGGVSIISHIVGTVLEAISAGVTQIPDLYVGAAGFGGSPVAVTHLAGGSKIGSGLRTAGSVLYNASSILDKSASLVSQIGNYKRRQEEWDFQGELATIEIDQVSKQIAAANIRVSITEKELKNQELVVENVKSEEEYLKNKYTNQQLYSWMLSQISSVYFQSYQLAYDMAKRAEKSFRRELGLQNSNYIQFGYWDSLKKGLLSGDRLMHDLHRMEAAYYDKNRRELELTKHISLAQVAPWCLLQLKTAGECVLDIPEWLFDMDYPGHYMRRIKSASISIPCIVGTYSGVHCSLSLIKSQVRTSTTVGGNYAWTPGNLNDPRFYFETGAIQSIATSHGQSDNGVFELNFNDEKFLPFEGAGAISTWKIKMPRANNQFDFSTISDVILHLQYTARNGGGNLELEAQANLDNNIIPTEGARLFSLKHEFPTEWHRFLHPVVPGSDQELKLNLGIENYPFLSHRKTNLDVTQIKIVIDGNHSGHYNVKLQLPGQPPPPNSATIQVTKDPAFANSHVAEPAPSALALPSTGRGEWNIKVARSTDTDFKSLPGDDIDDILMIVYFGVS